jgi:aspartate beta-hydroxylase
MSAPDPSRVLVQRARQSLAAGDERAAAAAFTELLGLAPNHLGALSFLAMQAFRAGDHAESLAHLGRALSVAPRDPVLLRNRAAVRVAAGDRAGAEADLRAAIAAEPGLALNPMQLGALLEDAGDLDAALVAYNEGLRLDKRLGFKQTSDGLPPPLPLLAERRRAAVHTWLTQRFEAALAGARATHPGVSLRHAEEALRLHRNERPLERRHPKQQPHEFFVPDLEPIPWCAREQLLPWAATLEAATDAIRAEYQQVAGHEGFEPYIDEPPVRSEAWLKLAKQTTWNSFFLYRKAQPVEANVVRCPATLAALAAVPLSRTHGQPTEVFFSVLAPKAHIPPHWGLTNAKCVVHLPLIVPPGCSIRVGDETRGWTVGEVFAFDDSFDHEARNDSDQHRVVLIFEVWNPQLNPAEVMAIGGMLDAITDFKQI